MKSVVMNVIQNNTWFKKMIIYIFNKFELGRNTLCVANIHFSKNCIKMSLGKHQKFICHERSYLRCCNVHMAGSDNAVQIDADTQIYGEKSQVFYIDGNNNVIVIGKNCTIRNTTFFIRGNNNVIQIEDNVSSFGVQFHIEQNDNHLRIGKGTTFHGRDGYPIHIALDEGSTIDINDDCMLSNGIQIRSSDSHSIVDLNGKRLNPAKDIVIGKHCWFSFGCVVLKGTHIADCTVIAAGAVCTKIYTEKNCVLAGNPAKIVKREIDWDRKLL